MSDRDAFETIAEAAGFHDFDVSGNGCYCDDFLQHFYAGWEARGGSRQALSSCPEIPNSSGHACRQAVSVPDAWCVVTNDDQIQYTAMVDKNLGLPIEQSHDYAWQQCNEVIQEWIELGLDAASKYVIRPIAFEERVAELECMVRAFRACVDLQMVPSWGSPCHDQIHALVGKNTEEGT